MLNSIVVPAGITNKEVVLHTGEHTSLLSPILAEPSSGSRVVANSTEGLEAISKKEAALGACEPDSLLPAIFSITLVMPTDHGNQDNEGTPTYVVDTQFTPSKQHSPIAIPEAQAAQVIGNKNLHYSIIYWKM